MNDTRPVCAITKTAQSNGRQFQRCRSHFDDSLYDIIHIDRSGGGSKTKTPYKRFYLDEIMS